MNVDTKKIAEKLYNSENGSQFDWETLPQPLKDKFIRMVEFILGEIYGTAGIVDSV